MRWKLQVLVSIGAFAFTLSALTLLNPLDPVEVRRAELQSSLQRIGLVESNVKDLLAQITSLEASIAGQYSTARNEQTLSDPLADAEFEEDAEFEDEDWIGARLRWQMSIQSAALAEFLQRERNIEGRLIFEGGISPERAYEIAARDKQLIEEGRARIEAWQRETGEDVYPVLIENLEEHQRILRQEFGEEDYERYRRAAGMSTGVYVERVFSGSNAEFAGILPGDVVLEYDGERVMDARELERHIMGKELGVPVLIEVRRNGERLSLSAPRGALGVAEMDPIARIAHEIEERIRIDD